jgi:Uma2 family endonuclease
MNAVFPTTFRLNHAQFEDMARKGAFATIGRVELRGGVVSLMAPVHFRHSVVKIEFAQLLLDAVRQRGGDLRVLDEISVLCGDRFVPTVDLVVARKSAIEPTLDGPLPIQAVCIAVEVADTSLSDDLGEKMRDFARSGMTEYWVVDVRGRVIFLHAEPGEDGYRTREVVKFGETIAARTLDLGFSTAALLNV